MIQSSFYKKSKQENNVAPSVLFAETIPPRWKSMIPTLNFSQGFPTDNNWVSLEMLPDNKTFVSTNDSNIRLEMDPLTLETKKKFKWSKDGDYVGGVSRSSSLPCTSAVP